MYKFDHSHCEKYKSESRDFFSLEKCEEYQKLSEKLNLELFFEDLASERRQEDIPIKHKIYTCMMLEGLTYKSVAEKEMGYRYCQEFYSEKYSHLSDDEKEDKIQNKISRRATELRKVVAKHIKEPTYSIFSKKDIDFLLNKKVTDQNKFTWKIFRASIENFYYLNNSQRIELLIDGEFPEDNIKKLLRQIQNKTGCTSARLIELIKESLDEEDKE